MVAAVRPLGQFQAATLYGEQAPAERQAYAVARALGGEERHEDRCTRLRRDGLAVVAQCHEQVAALLVVACINAHLGGAGLHGILCQVDHHLLQHVGISVD